jgi:abortive infection bacteriophage resistance protein
MVDKYSKKDYNNNIVVATPLTEVPIGDSFFDKSYLSPLEHISLLQSRGLIINLKEKEDLIRLIEKVGYYSFSRYFKHFYQKNSKTFQENTSAIQIIQAFEENEVLRYLLVPALLSLEARLSTLIVETMVQQSSDIYWHLHKDFETITLSPPLSSLRNNPSWELISKQDFGTLCKILQRIPYRSKKKILRTFHISKPFRPEQIYDIFNGLRFLRNQCVHKEKLLGEGFKTAPPPFIEGSKPHHLSNLVHWIIFLSLSIDENNTLKDEIEEIRTRVKKTLPKTLHF